MRKCLPLTTLTQQQVEHVPLSPAMKREIFIRETERTMIAGADAGLWDGSIGMLRDTKFFTQKSVIDADFSGLEMRIMAQMAMYGRNPAPRHMPTGRLTGQFMAAALANGQPVMYTTSELSPDYLKKKFAQHYPMVDAFATKAMWDSLSTTPPPADSIRCIPAPEPRWRTQLMNYDALFPR